MTTPDPHQPPPQQPPYQGQQPYQDQPPYSPQQPYPGQPYYGYAPPPPTNSNAMVAMIVSLVSLVTCPLVGAVGIYLGNRARAEIRRSGEQGDGMAQAGVIVGWIAVGLAILTALLVAGWFVFVFGMFATTTTYSG